MLDMAVGYYWDRGNWETRLVGFCMRQVGSFPLESKALCRSLRTVGLVSYKENPPR